MATTSFEKNLIIRTEDEAQRVLEALEEADSRDPVAISDFSEELKNGEKIIKRGYKSCNTQ